MSKKSTTSKNTEIEDAFEIGSSRRRFIKHIGTAAAGLLVVPYLKPSGIFAYAHRGKSFLGIPSDYLATVAITDTTNTPADSYTYDDSAGGVLQKVQYFLNR
jgi:hypothetical protein